MTKIPLSGLVVRPAPGLAVPTSIEFSPSGRWIGWLHGTERDPVRRLFVHDVDSGARFEVPAPADPSTLTRDEELRRQRLRDYGQGVSRFTWTRGDGIIVSTSDAVHSFDIDSRTWSPLVEAGATLTDPRVAPDGRDVAWVRDGELWVRDAFGERALTEHVADGVTHGLADYVAQEELDRMHGFWWSPDGKRIAYTRVDERGVPLLRIARTSSDPYDEELHRYPFAGMQNAVTKLFVVEVATGEHTEVELGDFEYLVRVDWADSDTLYVQTMERSQKSLSLQAHDVLTGETTLLLEERSASWINVHSLLRPLADGFVWASERSGFVQLQLHDRDGSLLHLLGPPGKNVHDVRVVGDDLVVVADGDSARERRAYRVGLDGASAVELTPEPGTHRVAASRRFVTDLHDSLSQPPRLLLRSLDGDVVRTLFDEQDPRVDGYGIRPPVQRSISGDVELDVTVFEPDGVGPHPTLVHVYGGPHVQLVRDSWSVTAQLDLQYLRERGVCVISVDNRGSANRGKDFEAAIAGNLGDLEVRDQAFAVERLVDEGLVDQRRIAVIGASYGGYMAAMCLARRPDLFKAAVAQAPVSHWGAYDTCYTERYMGLPGDNRDGYERSSLMHHVAGIEGELLLVHGMIDENVHFRHTARLIDSLIEHQKDYRLLLYPNERHGPVGDQDRMHMKKQINQFIETNLGVSE